MLKLILVGKAVTAAIASKLHGIVRATIGRVPTISAPEVRTAKETTRTTPQ